LVEFAREPAPGQACYDGSFKDAATRTVGRFGRSRVDATKSDPATGISEFAAAIFQKLRTKRREYDCAVVANRFDRATFQRFFAERFLLRGLWLLVNVGMTPFVVAFEIGGCRFAAQIAVDALIIDVECPGYVFGVFVRGVGHSFYQQK
jgi:hypothetical protein